MGSILLIAPVIPAPEWHRRRLIAAGIQRMQPRLVASPCTLRRRSGNPLPGHGGTAPACRLSLLAVRPGLPVQCCSQAALRRRAITFLPPLPPPPLAILSHKAGPAVRQHGCGCVMPLSCKPGTSRHSRGAVYATRAGHRPCVQWALPEKRGSLMARHSTCHMAPRCVPVSVHLRLRGLTPWPRTKGGLHEPASKGETG